MDQEAPSVSVVIPVYNGVDLLARCLASLRRQTGVACEVIVVDDASPEDPELVTSRHPQVRLLRQGKNTGYAAANNAGLQVASGCYILFLNSDTELPADGLKRLVAYLEDHPEAGGVAPLHRDASGRVQLSCLRFPTPWVGLLWDSALHRLWPEHRVLRDYRMADWDQVSERWVEHAATSCLMIRREVYEAIGGMDERLVLYYNDTDFCYRMHRAGYRIRFLPEVEILHHGGASVRTFENANARLQGDRYRYYRKWFGWRGALAVRLAATSRLVYEAVAGAASGHPRLAGEKLRQLLSLNLAMRD